MEAHLGVELVRSAIAAGKTTSWILAAVLLFGCRGDPPAAPAHTEPAAPAPPPPAASVDIRPLSPLLDDVHRRSFDFFWDTGNPRNGLIPDRWPTPSYSSIAAVGFGLGTYGVGVERGWISRDQAIERTLATLRYFDQAPMGDAASGTAGHRGFFYHFLDMDSGTRYATNELSTVDTALLIAGMLFSQSYFDRDDPREAEIRGLVDRIYQRVDWAWMQVRDKRIAMGWDPETGLLDSDWHGYNEAMLVYLLALASPTHPVELDAWQVWMSTYEAGWGDFYGQTHLNFPPLFGHQYSHIFYDFRGIHDDANRKYGLDYFENSRRAVLSQQAYAIANPMGWKDYGKDIWGLTASDGPADVILDYNGESRVFRSYVARGVALQGSFDDGTIAPTAALGSMPFAPEQVSEAAEAMHARYGHAIYGRYGFFDAFNPSFTWTDVPLKHGDIVPDVGWVADDYLGIDQGAIVLMLENHRSELLWRVLRGNPVIRRGLERAGFTGGWLEQAP